MTTTNTSTIDHMAGLVLDFVQNDPTIAAVMEEYIAKQYPAYTYDASNYADEEEWEASSEYALYYTLTAEFHTKVLAQAIMNLCRDPLAD